jgi:type VI secretion system protein ImpL
MKRKIGVSVIVVVVLALYLAGVWWLSSALGVQGRTALILRGGLALLGVLVAGVTLTYLLRKPAPPPPPKDAVAEEVQRALLAAEKKLATAKVAPSGALGKLPVVLMLGTPGSTKTSSVVRSGLDVELLTGDVFRDDAVVTTRGVNLWFGRNTLFVEAGRDITDDASRWRWFLHRLQPARLRGALSSGQQAPRVAVVCYSCEALTSATAGDAAVAAARALRDRLVQLAQAFGIRLPVYVVFSKVDRVPGFAEYVQNFTKDEGRAVLGATLPLVSKADGASHAERETRRLNDLWSRMFSGLAARRLDVLARETASDRKPAAYEFPREVRKLGTAAVQFLVELSRPTELGVGPVLRGFYLTGVRAVVTGDAAAAIPSLMAAREPQAAVAATSVFRPVGASAGAPAGAPASGARKKPEWVFLSGLFQDVVLADSVAMGVTRGGARISALRRTLAAVGVGVAAALMIAFSISFVRNRALQRSVGRAASLASALPAATVAVPSTQQLTTLDSLRERVEVLSRYYHDGAPFSLRWGLYSGDQLYGPARALYFEKFARLLYDSTRAGVLRATRALAPNASLPNAVPYDSAYQLLRTYLVTTSENTHSTPEFVGPHLVNAWGQASSVDSAARELARRQFEFVGRELPYKNPYDDQADPGLVTSVRAVLAKSAGLSPIYISMLTAAARHGQAVRFTAGQGAVVNPAEVAPQFTKNAWGYFVDTALTKDLDKFLQGEPWVTGGGLQRISDRDSLARALRRLYIADYVAAWKRYVKSASIAGFNDLSDAARKVQLLSQPTSPLLAMLLPVSENTVVDSAFVRAPLQPVDVVMPLKNKDTFIGGANQDYMDQLGALSNALQQLVAVPRGADNNAQLQATLAASGKVGEAASKLSRQFSAEPERELSMTALLSAPGIRVRNLVTGALESQQKAGAASAANAAAAAFCAQVQPVLDKFPFSRAQTPATRADIAKLFKPTGGDVAQFYDQALANTVLVRSGAGYRAAPGAAPTEGLIRFMTNARRITEALFPNGASEPRVQFSLRPHMGGTTPVTITFGEETFRVEKGNEQPILATWHFGDGASVAFSRPGSNRQSSDGTWAPFRMYWGEAVPGGPNGGRNYTVTLSGVTVGTVEMSLVGGLFEDPSAFALSCPTVAVK